MNAEEKKMYQLSIKSMDTEELLDLWFYRPLGFRCALFFRKYGVHPNVITIISIFYHFLSLISTFFVKQQKYSHKL